MFILYKVWILPIFLTKWPLAKKNWFNVFINDIINKRNHHFIKTSNTSILQVGNGKTNWQFELESCLSSLNGNDVNYICIKRAFFTYFCILIFHIKYLEKCLLEFKNLHLAIQRHNFNDRRWLFPYFRFSFIIYLIFFLTYEDIDRGTCNIALFVLKRVMFGTK